MPVYTWHNPYLNKITGKAHEIQWLVNEGWEKLAILCEVLGFHCEGGKGKNASEFISMIFL